MVNIMLEGYDIGAEWLKGQLSEYIAPGMKVAVAALSFRESRVRSAEDWDRLYAPGGRFGPGIAGGFRAYGIAEEDISYIDYFRDSRDTALGKIASADILYFLGGLPDMIMKRTYEMGLTEAMKRFHGVVMGYSAGAVVQLSEYHLSPDDDYPEFGYYRGLGYIGGFYHEVHYEGTAAQRASIARVLSERQKTVYATKNGMGALIAENGAVRTVGAVEVFEP